MSLAQQLAQLAAVPILIGINAFFVCAEFAIVAIRTGQIEQLRARNPGAADTLRKLKENINTALATLAICITMTNLVLGWIGEPAMTHLLLQIMRAEDAGPVFRGFSTAMSFFLVTLFTVVLSELVPKAITLRYTLPLARVTAMPLLFLQAVLKPLVWMTDRLADLTTRAIGLGSMNMGAEAVTAEEIQHIATESAESGHLTGRERTLILNSLTLGRRTAAEVMVPRMRVSYLDIQRTMQENLDAISHYLFSRMPLCDGGMDHVIGVVYTKEFLTAFQETEDSSVLLLIARQPVFAPVTVPLDKLLARFHDDKAHLMFLVDEHGSVNGIVTLTDVVNELVGPMHEGQDARIISRDGETLIVRGEMPISHLADHLNRAGWAADADVRSVGGLVVSKLGRVPRTGEAVEIDGVRLIAHKTNSRVVEEVMVKPPPPVLEEKPADEQKQSKSADT